MRRPTGAVVGAVILPAVVFIKPLGPDNEHPPATPAWRAASSTSPTS
jgi:hypothetical protein